MLAPIAFHPVASQVFLEKMIRALGSEADFTLPQGLCRLALLGFIVLECMVWFRAIGLKKIDPRKGCEHLLETFGLIGMFYFLPPLLSVGIYFLWLHALRHSLRLLNVCSINEARNVWINLCILHLKSFLFVVPVLVALFIWWLADRSVIHLNDQSIANYLVVIAALTLPHALFITAFDIRKAP